MPPTIEQAGVLAGRGGRVCLITSLSGRHWGVPKGHVEPGQTPRQCALLEAYEEAGIEGPLSAEPVAAYCYTKLARDYRVTLFRMTPEIVHAAWPESHLRVREWVTPDEAIHRVRYTELQALLASIAAGELALESPPDGSRP